MPFQCECAPLHHAPSARVDCHECGTACCRSCALPVDDATYCRWCATALLPAPAA